MKETTQQTRSEAKRRNDAWCKWVADHKDANDAAYAAFEAKDPDAWKRVPYTTLMKNGVGIGRRVPFDAEWFKSEPTADEKPPDIDPGFLDGCFDEIDPSSGRKNSVFRSRRVARQVGDAG